MALALPHIKFLLDLRKAGIFKSPARLIEFGEQNWFGDVPATEIFNVANLLSCSEEFKNILKEKLTLCINDVQSGISEKQTMALFSLAKLYYYTVFNLSKHDAVDLHGTSIAQKYDLNNPLPIKEKYDIAINFGTGEHVFNQYQFFKNLHDVTDAGGYMLHSMPNQGCYDHGFFNYHPTFLFDLAEANNYKIEALAYVDLSQKPEVAFNITRVKYIELAVSGKLSKYSALFAALQKTEDKEFSVPQQAYYNNQLPEDLKNAWERLER